MLLVRPEPLQSKVTIAESRLPSAPDEQNPILGVFCFYLKKNPYLLLVLNLNYHLWKHSEINKEKFI